MKLKLLENKYLGASVFSLMSGPSLSDLPLQKLQRHYSFSQKIIPQSHIKTIFWLCMEKNLEIPWQIWEDRTLIKFVPDELMEKGYLQPQNKNAPKVVYRNAAIGQLPNIYSFPVNNAYNSATYFTQDSITWGCDGNMIDEHGLKGRRSIMLAHFRLLYYLGFRKIYLCGCDFDMNHAKPYCYNISKTEAAAIQNNILYETLSIRFAALLPYFQEYGLEVFNCNPNSKLTVFPFISFQDALNDDQSLYRN